RYPEGERQFPGPVGELLQWARGASAGAHEIHARHGLERANQHTAGPSVCLRHQVEALVHAVDHVDVGVARRSEDDARTLGEAAGGVGRQIVAAQVRFGLDDDAGGGTVDQHFAEQGARHLHGGAGIERSRENRAEDHCTMLNGISHKTLPRRSVETSLDTAGTGPEGTPCATLAGRRVRNAGWKCDCLRDWNCRAMWPATWQSCYGV